MITSSIIGHLVDWLDRPARRAGQSPTGWSASRSPSDRGSIETGDASVRPTVNASRLGMSFDRM
jgi:hypothetical protein